MWSTGPEKAKEAQCALAARRRAACFSLSLSSALGRACLPCRPYTLREAVPPGSGAGPRQLLASARFAAVFGREPLCEVAKNREALAKARRGWPSAGFLDAALIAPRRACSY
jgi:hypothetical protein